MPCLVTHALSYVDCTGLTCCIVLWNRVPRSLCCPLARVFASFCLKKYIVGYRVISGLTKRLQRLPSAFGGPTCFATSSHLYVAAQFVNVTKIPCKPRQACCNLSKVPHAHFEVWSMDFITDLPMSWEAQKRTSVLRIRLQSASACVPYSPASTSSQSTAGLRLTPCFVGEGRLGAPSVARLFFDAVVRFFGCPRKVLHDRDPRFTSNFWRALWRILGVSVALSSAYHPQTDG